MASRPEKLLSEGVAVNLRGVLTGASNLNIFRRAYHWATLAFHKCDNRVTATKILPVLTGSTPAAAPLGQDGVLQPATPNEPVPNDPIAPEPTTESTVMFLPDTQPVLDDSTTRRLDESSDVTLSQRRSLSPASDTGVVDTAQTDADRTPLLPVPVRKHRMPISASDSILSTTLGSPSSPARPSKSMEPLSHASIFSSPAVTASPSPAATPSTDGRTTSSTLSSTPSSAEATKKTAAVMPDPIQSSNRPPWFRLRRSLFPVGGQPPQQDALSSSSLMEASTATSSGTVPNAPSVAVADQCAGGSNPPQPLDSDVPGETAYNEWAARFEQSEAGKNQKRRAPYRIHRELMFSTRKPDSVGGQFGFTPAVYVQVQILDLNGLIDSLIWYMVTCGHAFKASKTPASFAVQSKGVVISKRVKLDSDCPFGLPPDPFPPIEGVPKPEYVDLAVVTLVDGGLSMIPADDGLEKCVVPRDWDEFMNTLAHRNAYNVIMHGHHFQPYGHIMLSSLVQFSIDPKSLRAKKKMYRFTVAWFGQGSQPGDSGSLLELLDDKFEPFSPRIFVGTLHGTAVDEIEPVNLKKSIFTCLSSMFEIEPDLLATPTKTVSFFAPNACTTCLDDYLKALVRSATAPS